MKIKQKISTAFVKIFISISLVEAFFVGAIVYKSMTQQADRLVQTASLTKVEYLRSYLISQREMGTSIMGSSIFHDFLDASKTSPEYNILKKKVDETLIRTIKNNPKINELFIINTDATIVASSNNKRINQNVAQDDFFIEGKKGPFIRNIYQSPVTKTLVWGISLPIIDDTTGKPMGIVAMRLETAPLYQLIQSQSNLGSTAEVFVVDNNRFLLSPALYLNSNQILKKKIETQNVRDCFTPAQSSTSQKGNMRIYKDYRNILILGTHAHIPEINWCLITKIDALEVYTPLLWVLGIIIVITLLGTYIFYRVSFSVSKKITSPIDALYKGMLEVQKGNINYKVGVTSTDEIGDLSRQFDSLTDAVGVARVILNQTINNQISEINAKTKDLEDQKKAILNVLEDVEREKSKSEQLAVNLKKFELAVENANDQIIITDPDGIIIFANKSVERITGFPISEIMGKKAGIKELWGGLMPVEFYTDLWKTIKVDKQPFNKEVRNKRKNGEYYFAQDSISPVLNNDNEVEYFVGIERDVSKEVQIDKMKTEFISLASHQLRTPLTAMNWFVEMLIHGDMGPLSSVQIEAMHSIDASNKRMISLVNSLLNISRIESGRLIIDPHPTDINKLMEDTVNELKKRSEENNQKIIFIPLPTLTPLPLDEKLMHEVFINLLTNALKYSPKNTQITISIMKKDNDALVQVHDEGYGIPLHQQDKIFQKFFRADNAVKNEADGTGLGLYLVKSIIESSDGKIGFESEENKGSTFWISLPLSGMREKKGDVVFS